MLSFKEILKSRYHLFNFVMDTQVKFESDDKKDSDYLECS